MFACQANISSQTPAHSTNDSPSTSATNLQGAGDDALAIDILTPCSYDGQIGCVTTEAFKAADVSKINPESISLGTTIAGIAGSAVYAKEICVFRGQQNCVAAGPFFVGPPCSSSEYGCYLPTAPSIMQSFSNHTAVFVRTTGSDTKGDGSANAPFATAQKAFDVAYKSNGDIVIDLGEGTFLGIDLDLAGASEWPRRIAVRGAGAGVSKLGGINARGKDTNRADDKATSGKNVTITSNNSVNIGNIDARGGTSCCGSPGPAGIPGLIDLTGIVAGNINVEGSRGAPQANPASSDGGTVMAINSSIGDIAANGVTDNGDGLVSNGGIINLTSSAVGNVLANGGSKLSIGCGAHGGRIYLKDSTLKGASLAGGSGQDANGDICDGQMGSVRGSRQ
jgi:hypothetical protein